jgi:hypothetical protein
MNASLRSTTALLLGVLGFVACDGSEHTKSAVSPPLAPEAIDAGETLTDVLLDKLADIVRDPDAYSRARRLGSLLPTLGREGVPAVQQTLEDLLLDSRGTEIELMTRFWATHQPEAATTWAKQKTRPEYREAAVFTAISTWAEADPQATVEATWEWVVLPRIDRVVPAAVVAGWFERDEPAALESFIHGIPMGIPRQRAIAAYIQALLRSGGSEAVMRWGEALPDDDKGYKLAVFRRVASAFSILDAESGIAWCERHCDGPYGANLRGVIAGAWILRDGPAAMTWLKSTPGGYERDLAVRSTYGDWSRRQREDAMAWMASQASEDSDSWLEPAYIIYARLLSGDDPTAAIRWAERIKKDSERELILIGVARVWRHLDEAAAEAWLDQSSLSEAAREKARTPAEK